MAPLALVKHVPSRSSSWSNAGVPSAAASPPPLRLSRPRKSEIKFVLAPAPKESADWNPAG